MDELLPPGIQTLTEYKQSYRLFIFFPIKGKKIFHRRRSFSPQGDLLKEETSEEVIEFHRQGKRLNKMVIRDRELNVLEETRYLYDGEGFCYRKEVKVGPESSPRIVDISQEQSARLIIEKEGNAVRAIQKNRQGQIIKELLYSGESPDGILQYRYDKDNRLSQIEKKNPQGEIKTSEIYHYYPSGILSQVKWVDGQGNIIRNLHYSYPHGEELSWLICQVSSEKNLPRKGKRPLYQILRELTFYPKARDLPSQKEPDNLGKQTVQREFENGNYQGNWANEEMNGQGEFRFHDGKIYRGEFKDNQIQGQGTLRFPDGSLYRGDFSKGMMEGQGEFIWANGDRYYGAFQKDMMHGVGEFRWAKGDRFKGWFEKGERSNQGVYFPEKDEN